MQKNKVSNLKQT